MMLLPMWLFAQQMELRTQSQDKVVYLIPGQGADGRLFQNIHISHHDTVILTYLIPEKGEQMAAYAHRMAAQIDTTRPYAIVGVSLGGMLAVEMKDFLNPEEVIIIASAKCQENIPNLYKFFRNFPLHRVLGGRFYKFGTRFMQPFYEPMTKENQQIFRSMLKQKDPKFMKRAVRCIVEWENDLCSNEVIHIHGTEDRTLPHKTANPDITVENGTHMMTLARGQEISNLLNQYIQ